MKKLYIFFIVFILQAGPVLAASKFFEGLDNTKTGAGYKDVDNSANFLAKMMGTALTPIFMGVTGMLLFFYGGYTIMMARGNEQKIEKGKAILINTAIAMIVAFSAYAIVKLILPLWEFVTVKQ